MNEIEITSDNIDSRLDKFLFRMYPGVSKGLIYRLIRQKHIRVNNKRSKEGYLLQLGDLIKVPKINEVTLGTNMVLDIHVMFEDDDFIVINKSRNMAVQPGTGEKKDISTFLSQKYSERIYPLHRLDKMTSGCLIYAKKYQIARSMAQLFKDKKVSKIYRAISFGKWPFKKNKYRIDQPLLIQSDNVQKVHGAITDLKLLKQTDKYCYLELMPVTGRKHQLRRHLQEHHLPIVGDDKYGNFKLNKEKKHECLLLHAHIVEFYHPVTNEKLIFKSPVPKDMDEFLRLFFN